MADRVLPGSMGDSVTSGRDAVCIDTKKIFDSCREKDCAPSNMYYPPPLTRTPTS